MIENEFLIEIKPLWCKLISTDIQGDSHTFPHTCLNISVSWYVSQGLSKQELNNYCVPSIALGVIRLHSSLFFVVSELNTH